MSAVSQAYTAFTIGDGGRFQGPRNAGGAGQFLALVSAVTGETEWRTVSGSGEGEANEGENLPAPGAVIYAGMSGVNLTFRRIQSSNNSVSVAENPNNLDITATAASVGADPAGSAAAVQGNLDTHVADLANPHGTTFPKLTDTPASYAGAAAFLVRVNAGANGLEFVDGATLYDAAGSAAAVQANLTAHIGDGEAHGLVKSGSGNLYLTDDGSYAPIPSGSGSYNEAQKDGATISTGRAVFDFRATGDASVEVTDIPGSDATRVTIDATAGAGGGGIGKGTPFDTGNVMIASSSVGDGEAETIGVSAAQLTGHLADGTIHFTEASIDHTAILNVGTNTHAQIDAHIADVTGNPHNVTAAQAGADPAGSAAAVQSNLDAHTSNVANPHSTTFRNLGETPASYVGAGSFLVRVNAGATAVEFVDGGTLFDASGSAAAVQSNLDAHTSDLDIHFPDAPDDGNDYVRQSFNWVQKTIGDVFSPMGTIGGPDRITLFDFAEPSGILLKDSGVQLLTAGAGTLFLADDGTYRAPAGGSGGIQKGNPFAVGELVTISSATGDGELQSFGLTSSDLSNHLANGAIHFSDAPADNDAYARQDNNWQQVVRSDDTVNDVVALTRAAYDGLGTKDPKTLYILNG